MMSSRQMILIFVCAAACSRKDEAPSQTTLAPNPAPAPTADSPRLAVNPCEHTGLWAQCSLERRLKQSGFVVKKLDEQPDRAGFKPKPIVYSLGDSRLEVFLYDSEKGADLDLAQLDTVTVAPKGAQPAWPSTPAFIHSANLVAVLLTQNQRQAERVVLAITAGPPQPGSPR